MSFHSSNCHPSTPPYLVGLCFFQTQLSLRPANFLTPYFLIPATPAQSACLICAVATLAGLCFLVPAFMATQSFTSFMACFAVGQFLVFLLQVRCEACAICGITHHLSQMPPRTFCIFACFAVGRSLVFLLQVRCGASGMCVVAGQNPIYIRCMHNIFGRKIIKRTVICGAYMWCVYTVLANPRYVLCDLSK